MKIIKILPALILLSFASCSNSKTNSDAVNQYINSSIVPIKKFADIKHHNIDSKTLVLLDIDNTIFSAKSYYGSTEEFGDMIDEEIKKKNVTESQATLDNYSKWIKSQSEIETKLVDEKIHDFISLAKSNNATILAFTARQPIISEITFKQLNKHKIEFDQLPNFNFNSDKLYENKPGFYKGIIFAHVLNSKGQVFKDFYQAYKNYSANNNIEMFDKIIFIDDVLYNLESLEQTVKDLNIEFYGYHIEHISDFNPTKLTIEENSSDNK